jgi:hypothetical protein
MRTLKTPVATATVNRAGSVAFDASDHAVKKTGKAKRLPFGDDLLDAFAS